MKIVYLIASILFSILGIIHTACTPVFYNLNSLDALWFAGTGLALFVLGLFNIATLKSTNKPGYNLCILCNVLSFIFYLFITIRLGEPQAFIGIFLLLVMLVESVNFRMKIKLD